MSKELQRIIDTLVAETRIFPDTGGLLFAVSGGPDSMVLVDVFANYCPEIKKRMHIAYIHHGIRKNADRELEFVRKLAEKIKIPFSYKKIRMIKDNKTSLEEQARIKRYQSLISIAKKSGCSAIVTAHTMDDHVETIILNLISGSGLKGLCGISPVSKIDSDILLLRPMLGVTKKQVLMYLKEKGIDYMIDESNIETKFRRNFIRQNIFPLFEKLNPAFRENISRTSKILKDEYEFLSLIAKKEVEKKISVCEGTIRFSRKEFVKLHPAIQRFFLRRVLMDLCNLSYPVDFTTTETIRLSIISEKKQRYIDKLKIFLKCDGDSVILCFGKKEKKFFLKKPVKLVVPGETLILETNWKIKVDEVNFSKKFLVNRDISVAYINKEKIEKGLVVKSPDRNECFIPLGMKNRVSFKKYWKTHKKKITSLIEVPLVITDGDKIVWVIGGSISQEYAIEKGKKVIKIMFKKTQPDFSSGEK